MAAAPIPRALPAPVTDTAAGCSPIKDVKYCLYCQRRVSTTKYTTDIGGQLLFLMSRSFSIISIARAVLQQHNV